MSLITEIFQDTILTNLSDCLKSKSNIYKYPILNPQTPAIIMQYNKIENQSNSFVDKYSVDFIINLIFKDIDTEYIQNIRNIILDQITENKIVMKEFEVVGIKNTETRYKQSENISTFKNVFYFQAMIKKFHYVQIYET